MNTHIRFVVAAMAGIVLCVSVVLPGCGLGGDTVAPGAPTAPAAAAREHVYAAFDMTMGEETGMRGTSAEVGGVTLTSGTVTPSGDNLSADVQVNNASLDYTMHDVQVRVSWISDTGITYDDVSKPWDYGTITAAPASSGLVKWTFTKAGGPGSFTFTVRVSWWAEWWVTRFAGQPGSWGYADGDALTTAKFNYIGGVAVHSSGDVYVPDAGTTDRIRKISGGQVSTLAGTFNNPEGVAVDASGNVYVADTSSHCIRKISGATVTTFAGSPGNSGLADGDAATARFYNPSGLAIDSSGNLYVADRSNKRVRKITSAAITSTLAGTTYLSPYGVAVDSSGNDVYVGDTGNNCIRKIAGGSMSTFAGTEGPTGGYQDGAALTEAKFNHPRGVALDSFGTVYVADFDNHRIRRISAGSVTTLAGTGTAGFLDDVPPTQAKFNCPYGIAVDAQRRVYVGDYSNYCIRKIHFK